MKRSFDQRVKAKFERLQGIFEQAARFSADASHKLKTPIAVLRAGIEEISRSTRIIRRASRKRGGPASTNTPAQFVSLKFAAAFTRRHWSSGIARDGVQLRQFLDGSLEDARILGAGNNLQIETDISRNSSDEWRSKNHFAGVQKLGGECP